MIDRAEAVLEWWRRHPVAGALLVGLFLRVVAVLSGFGWFAADDYYYVVEPAWRWLEQPELSYVSRIRSPLFPRFFWLLLAIGDQLADDPRWVLRIAYLGLGFLSLAIVPGVYRLARPLGAEAAATAALLAAAYALMPRLGTRALLEAVAMVPLVWSMVAFVSGARGDAARRFGLALAGGALFALAAMLRFQVGVIGVAVLGWMVVRAVRTRDESVVTRWAPVAGLAVAALLGALAHGWVDQLEGRPWFGTLAAYLNMNVERSSGFGKSAWYTYLLHLILYTVPPATLALARPLWRACRAFPLVSVSLALFVLAHSLVPHKEDRFLFPVLPLLLVLLAAALVEIRRAGVWQRRAYVFFWAVNVVALPFACLSDAHRNMTEPLLELAATEGAHDVAVVGARRVPRFYLGSEHRVHTHRKLGEFLEEPGPADFILVRPLPDDAALARLRDLGCAEPKVFSGDFVDRALVALNPRRNKRRRPTGLLDCR